MHVEPKVASVWQFSPAVQSAGCVTDKFSRERRIVKTDDFSSVFRLRPKHRTAHFVLYTRAGMQKHARLGIVVAKRFAPRAVTRNTIKRICREVFRLKNLPALDCIVRLSSPVNARSDSASNADLKRQLKEELRKLFALQVKDMK